MPANVEWRLIRSFLLLAKLFGLFMAVGPFGALFFALDQGRALCRLWKSGVFHVLALGR